MNFIIGWEKSCKTHQHFKLENNTERKIFLVFSLLFVGKEKKKKRKLFFLFS